MKIRFLRANNGDSFLLTFLDHDKNVRNILIDGGTPNTYSYKDNKGKNTSGDLQIMLEGLKGKIDLLILTHVDDDHIGGILKWFGNNPHFPEIVNKVWFNSGKLIFEKFKVPEILENQRALRIKNGRKTSIKQGVTFENYAVINNIWERKLIASGDTINFYNVTFKILSPSQRNLESLLSKWSFEQPSSLTSKFNDYKKTLAEHIKEDKFIEDDTVHNGSSIAFNLLFEGKNYLFLSDAHPSTIIDELKKNGYSTTNKLKAEFIKLSHHGSKGNTSEELLNLIDTNNFIISSNGRIHNLPDKQCLSRIIKNFDNPNLLFNYPEIIDTIFSADDKKAFSFSPKPIVEYPI